MRLFAHFGFDHGPAGHITVRDPEWTDHFWINPLGVYFGHVRVSDLLLVNHDGAIVIGDKPVLSKSSPLPSLSVTSGCWAQFSRDKNSRVPCGDRRRNGATGGDSGGKPPNANGPVDHHRPVFA
jgi:hypothetical protein